MYVNLFFSKSSNFERRAAQTKRTIGVTIDRLDRFGDRPTVYTLKVEVVPKESMRTV